MPRPKFLNPERCRDLVAYVSAGLRLEHAARYVGCSVRTVRREADVNDQFRRDLAAAELSVRSDPEKLMSRAAGSYWRAAAWMLERRDPHRFGRRRPDACGPQELEEICTTLIETALAAASDDQARRALYLKMTASLREMTVDLFPAPHAARPGFSFHTYTDEQRMLDRIDQNNLDMSRFWDEPPQPKAAAAAASETPTTAASRAAPVSAPRPQPPAPKPNKTNSKPPTGSKEARQWLEEMRAQRLASNAGESFRPTGRDNSPRPRSHQDSPNSPRAERNGHHPPAGGEE